jgi:hypothetical protein
MIMEVKVFMQREIVKKSVRNPVRTVMRRFSPK